MPTIQPEVFFFSRYSLIKGQLIPRHDGARTHADTRRHYIRTQVVVVVLFIDVYLLKREVS